MLLVFLLAWLTNSPLSAQDHWVLRPIRTVGSFGSHVEFGSVTAATLGPRGIYIGDGINSRVVILDRDLSLLRTLGRTGSGPREFRSISDITVRGDTIYVYDTRLRRLNALSGTTGEELWTQSMVPKLPGENIAPHPSVVLADGAILVRGRASPGTPGHGLHRFDRESGERVRIATMDHSDDIPIGRAEYEGLTATVRRPVHAADRSAVAPGGAFVAILIQSDPAAAEDGSATIIVLNPRGDTLWARVLRTPRVRMDPGHVEKILDEGARAFAERVARTRGIPRGASMKAYREALAIPPFQLSFDRLATDGGGAVLLRRGSYGLAEAEWWRVTKSGIEAVFTLPTSHELLAAEGKRMYTTSAGSLDEPTLTAWLAVPDSTSRPK